MRAYVHAFVFVYAYDTVNLQCRLYTLRLGLVSSSRVVTVCDSLECACVVMRAIKRSLLLPNPVQGKCMSISLYIYIYIYI